MKSTERRRARRIADAVDLQIFPDSGKSGNQPQFDRATRFVRLSTTGLRVVANNALQSRQTVRLVMHLSNEATVQLTGQVVDTGEDCCNDGEQRYYTNIGFTDVPDDTRELLHNHVERVYRQTHSG